MSEPLRLPVIYGSYREERFGIRVADFAVGELRRRGHAADLLDAKAIGLPMLDRMFKEYPEGSAPGNMRSLAEALRAADGFVLVAGEYNWSVQPGLKNLVDHFLEEWFWRPVAIVSYATARTGGARANAAWHSIVAELGMVAVPNTVTVSDVAHAVDDQARPTGEGGQALSASFARTADTLEWWALAARDGRRTRATPF